MAHKNVRLGDESVYTIAAPERLAYAAAHGTELIERKRWVRAKQSFTAAQQQNLQMAVLFADARDCRRLIAWSTLKSVQVTPTDTAYRIAEIYELPRSTPQDLLVLSTGRPIADGFIRPYVPCRTPTFLHQEALAPRPWSGNAVALSNVKEGECLLRLHQRAERTRNRRIVEEVKRLARERGDGRLRCEVCSFDFAEVYGQIGAGYIEAHHIVAISDYPEYGGETTLEDFALVCANCHRMLHTNAKHSVESLKLEVRRLQKQRDMRRG